MAVQDKLHFVLGVHLILGMGTLLPYNSVLNSVADKAFGYSDVASSLTNVLIYTMVVFSVLQIFVGDFISLKFRIVTGYAILVVCMAAMPLPGFFWPLQDGATSVQSDNIRFFVMIPLCFLTGLATAMVQGSSFAFATMFPANYSVLVSSGAGLSGVVASTGYLISKAAFPGGSVVSSVVFYMLSSLLCLLCLISYIAVLQSAFAQFHLARTQEEKDHAREAKKAKEQQMFQDTIPELDGHRSRGVSGASRDSMHEPLIDPSDDTDAPVSLWESMQDLSRSFIVVIPMFLNLGITFCVFPIIASQIPSSVIGDFFIPWLFFAFNLADYAGRSLPSYVVVLSAKLLGPAVLLRALFIPAFYFLLDPVRYYTPSDYIVLAIMLGFGFTNGYCTSIAFMNASGMVKRTENKERAGILAVIMLVLGITAGQTVATIFDKVLFNHK